MADEHDPTPPSRRRRRRRSDLPPAPDLAAAEAEAAAEAATEAAAEAAIEVASTAEIEVASTAEVTSLPMLEARALDPTICPFLRSVGDDDIAIAPIGFPDPSNRCAAMHETVPQSLRQQELVCLSSGHVNCPRYLRGAAAVEPVAVRPVRALPSVSTPIAASIVILLLSFTASVGFVLANGGMDLASIDPSASPSAVAAATDEPTAAPNVDPTPDPTPTPAATPEPTPTAEPTSTPTAAPTATPTPAPTLEPTPTPAPTSDRYALLVPCPGVDACWIYTVRSGDNLSSIANYFGHSLATVYRLNPWAETQGLRAGQELRLPPPTR